MDLTVNIFEFTISRLESYKLTLHIRGLCVVMFGYCTIILAMRKVVQRIRLGT
jgi:hypothetical protein